MSDYNLDEATPESFEFVLGGNKYAMRYPTTEEINQAQKLEGSEAQLEWMYGFVKPLDEKAPSIKDALDKVNVKVLQRFNKMISTEFRGEE